MHQQHGVRRRIASHYSRRGAAGRTLSLGRRLAAGPKIFFACGAPPSPAHRRPWHLPCTRHQPRLRSSVEHHSTHHSRCPSSARHVGECISVAWVRENSLALARCRALAVLLDHLIVVAHSSYSPQLFYNMYNTCVIVDCVCGVCFSSTPCMFVHDMGVSLLQNRAVLRRMAPGVVQLVRHACQCVGTMSSHLAEWWTSSIVVVWVHSLWYRLSVFLRLFDDSFGHIVEDEYYHAINYIDVLSVECVCMLSDVISRQFINDSSGHAKTCRP